MKKQISKWIVLVAVAAAIPVAAQEPAKHPRSTWARCAITST